MTTLIKELSEMTWEGGKMPLVLLLKPSRRFEKLLAREVARAKRECGIHCWKRLVESLPDDIKRRKNGGKR